MATQKKYICAFCARAFTRSEHKQRHERSHTNEKPFHCNRCTSCFVRRDLLQRHCRTVHNIHDVSDIKFKDGGDTINDKITTPLTKKKKLNFPLNQSFEIHDLIHLLSITRKLDLILNNSKNNDTFLIGYTHLINHATPYTIFEKILVDLINYLNQFNNNKDTINPVKMGIIYSIISLGNVINLDYQPGLQYFIQSWNLLIKQLIPNYNNNNTNLLDQIDILNNLFILGFIYLNFNLAKICDDLILEFINNDIILNYLNDISFIIFHNLSNDEIMINLNLPLFWNIYLLLSNYLSSPPKIYANLKLKNLKIINIDDTNNDISYNHDSKLLSPSYFIGNESLQSIMENSTKSCINSQVSIYYKSIIISTLLNELKNFINGDEFAIFNSKNCLHNSIILVNKSFNIDDSSGMTNSSPPTETIPRRSSTGSVSLNSPTQSSSTIKLFALFKKNLIINSPLKFHELLQNYIFIPTQYYNWELLNITSQEINIYYPINQLLSTNLVNYNANFPMNLYNYFDYKRNNIDINNNLAIISFPIIFLSPYLNLKFLNLSNLNNHQLTNVNLIIFEWYLIMIKILLIIWNDCKIFEDNYILQSLTFLLLENKSPLLNKITKNQDLNTNDDNKFEFNHKWFMILKLKFDNILENWLDILKLDDIVIQDQEKSKSSLSPISNLKLNITQFIDNMLISETSKFNNNNGSSNDSFDYSNNPNNNSNNINNEITNDGNFNNVNNTNNLNNITNIINNNNSSISNPIMPPPTTDHQRRANSISLGILQHTGSAVEINAVTTPLISSYSSNNSFIRQASNNSNNIQPNRYQSYSAYAQPPPAPPILASSITNDLMLPPILPKNEENDTKGLKPLIPNVQRST